MKNFILFKSYSTSKILPILYWAGLIAILPFTSTSLDLYEKLLGIGIDVLLDDRDMRPGVMFAESDLIGIPYRIVVGQKSLENNQVEFKVRGETAATNINLSNILEELHDLINEKP